VGTGARQARTSIKDETFLKRVDSREALAKGDRLEVELEITSEFDSSLKEFLPKSYRVQRVLNHSIPDEPKQLSLDNE
jgi:hypothetical protein